MKTLIIIPTKDVADIHPECLKAAQAEVTQDVSLMINVVKALPLHSEQAQNKSLNAAYNRNSARTMALASNAEWFLCIDSDVVIPKNTINEFLKAIKKGYKLMGGWYQKRGGSDWVAGTFVEPNVLSFFTESAAGVVEVDMFGLGCAMMHRSVLEKVEFRGAVEEYVTDIHGTIYYVGDCTAFCYEAKRQGFPSHMIGTVICKHLPL